MFPAALICDKTDLGQRSGLFPEIGYYWVVKGVTITFWSYNHKHDLVLPTTFTQQITNVHLARVAPSVFDVSVTVGLCVSVTRSTCWC